MQRCEDEPIHVPGLIQARGTLLALDTRGVITHCAGILPDFRELDPLGRRLSDVLPELAGLTEARPVALAPRVTVDGRSYAARSHVNPQGLRILELESDDDLDHSAALRIPEILGARTSHDCLSIAVSIVRGITGHDRVLAYVFDRDHNGTVVAEDQRSGIPSYMDLRFPHTDIPPQALRLYRRKLVRLIDDIDYEPQRIRATPDFAAPLDLSDSDLRSVSPIHLEYMRNMNITASLVSSLIVGDEFIGMIACHHLSPRYITPTMRELVGTITTIAAHRVHAIRTHDLDERRVFTYREAGRMLLDLADEDASPDGLGTHVDRVRSLIDADGAAIVLGGRVHASGTTPANADVLRISSALADSSTEDVQYTDHLAAIDPALGKLSDQAAGVVRCRLKGREGDAVLWFRPEVTRSVAWAGDPASSSNTSSTSGGRLSPRTSFDTYLERVTGRSLPWEQWEIEAAEAVRGLVSDLGWRMRRLRELEDERQRSAQERNARDVALAASKAKSDFLANMSHEIRTPMTAILGYVDLLANDLRDDPEQAIHAVETIRTNATHLLSLINDVLDVSKIEAGQLKLETIRTDPMQLVRDVLSLIEPRARAAGVAVQVICDSRIPRTIMSDPTRLRQVLFNLAGNAAKFTERGSITIRISCDPARSTMQFQIVDTGIGMTPEQVERISRFEAFTQADESTTRMFGGTGLGLRICNALAGMLGGSLGIETTSGKGSTFTLTVATGDIAEGVFLEPEDAAGRTHEPEVRSRPTEIRGQADATGLEELRVLLVEDGADNRRLISFLLRKAGATVVLAEDGVEAVARMSESPPDDPGFDLVLMDMQMPRMDGYTATRRLREMGIHTPIVALTARAMEGDRQRCLNAGCDDYLTKPVDRTRLIGTVARLARGGDATGRSAA